MSDEIACLEQTLRERRAELREADKRLQECLSSIDTAKTEVCFLSETKIINIHTWLGYHYLDMVS